MAFVSACLLLSSLIGTAIASDVLVLNADVFDNHLAENKHTLVEFYAPWCGHCKKLEPEYEKAATALKGKAVFGKVDATDQKELATKYKVKGFPTMIWFEEGAQTEYDGGRTQEEIVKWVSSMIGPAVLAESPPPPGSDKPQVILRAGSLFPGFEEAAKANRRKASWYHVQDAGAMKVVVQHKGEEPLELTDGCDDKDKVAAFVNDNVLPLFGTLDSETWEKYMDAGKGLIWSLFPNTESAFEAVEAQQRPMMSEVAKKIRKNYFVTITDTHKFKEAVENMLTITKFPAIAVQKKAGDKRKYVYEGELTTDTIIKFIQDVDDGKVTPKLKSEPVPEPNDEPVKTLVALTLEQELFLPDKDVLLEVYAPWCGHCKKLEPEYQKLAKKLKKEELIDLVTMARIDGTANDSPIDSVDWTSFPTIYFAKAGTNEAVVYDGEKTAKGIWKYIKKHATKAMEIKDRLEKRKGSSKKGEEL